MTTLTQPDLLSHAPDENRYFVMNVKGNKTHLVNLDTNEICLNYENNDNDIFYPLLNITDCSVGRNAKLFYMDDYGKIMKSETGKIETVRILSGKHHLL